MDVKGIRDDSRVAKLRRDGLKGGNILDKEFYQSYIGNTSVRQKEVQNAGKSFVFSCFSYSKKSTPESHLFHYTSLEATAAALYFSKPFELFPLLWRWPF